MTIQQQVFNLYKGLSWRESLYIRLRWLVSPIESIERHLPSKGRIYDIGCGVGLLSNIAALGSPERDIAGIDLSREKINIANKSLGSRPNITFRCCDALTLALEKPAAVTICDMLHHISESVQRNLLQHVYKALGTDGLLLMQDIDKSPLYKYLFARGVDKLSDVKGSVCYRTSAEWINLLEDIGFKVDAERLDKGYPIAAVLFVCRKR